MDRNMTNIKFIDDKEFNQKIEDGKKTLLEAIKNNNEIKNLIKLDIKIDFDLTNINSLDFTDIAINSNGLYITFQTESNIADQIKNVYLKKYASCEEDAAQNFNKYKINRYFLLPVDFEIKMRSPNYYLDYLLDSLKKSIVNQIIFTANKQEWGYDGTMYSYYLIYKQNIATLSDDQKDNKFLEIAKKHN